VIFAFLQNIRAAPQSMFTALQHYQINSIVVTVGARSRRWPFPKSELEGGAFTSRVKSRLEKNNAFRLAHLLPRLAG
jgi:hypothetical protein